MTSVKDDTAISEEARNLLANQYREAGKPWFASVIVNQRFHQFDESLKVITRLIT